MLVAQHDRLRRRFAQVRRAFHWAARQVVRTRLRPFLPSAYQVLVWLRNMKESKAAQGVLL